MGISNEKMLNKSPLPAKSARTYRNVWKTNEQTDKLPKKDTFIFEWKQLSWKPNKKIRSKTEFHGNVKAIIVVRLRKMIMFVVMLCAWAHRVSSPIFKRQLWTCSRKINPPYRKISLSGQYKVKIVRINARYWMPCCIARACMIWCNFLEINLRERESERNACTFLLVCIHMCAHAHALCIYIHMYCICT